MVKKQYKYLFKRLWYYHILNNAQWYKYRYNQFELGQILKHPNGTEYEIISEPIEIGKDYYKCLIIKL